MRGEVGCVGRLGIHHRGTWVEQAPLSAICPVVQSFEATSSCACLLDTGAVIRDKPTTAQQANAATSAYLTESRQVAQAAMQIG